MKRFWQGHSAEELLLCLVAAIFFICLTLGVMRIAFIEIPEHHTWEFKR
jgi:hypothetical protein